MSKGGKPNTFFKGMKADMEESLQLKDSYRYAKNARISSHDGDNISIQPYPSDKLALTFRGESSYVNGLQTLSCTNSWVAEGMVVTISDALENAGFDWPPEIASLEETWGPIELPGEYTSFTANTDNPVSLTIQVETVNGNSFTMSEDITTAYLATQVWNLPFDVDNVVAGIISQSDNGILATSSINGNIGNCSSTTNWMFINTEDTSDYVSSFSVSIQGTGSFSITNQSLIEQYLISTLPPIEPPQGNDIGAIIAYNLALAVQEAFVSAIFDAISTYYNSQEVTQINTTLINNEEVFPAGLTLFEQAAENLGFSPDQPGIQILGTYSFSDQLIILAKWPLMGVLQAEGGSPVACDLVIKVKSAPDGTLNGEGLEGFGDFIPFEELGSLYTIYYVGDLEFSLNKKIKITGSEESGKTRRIYFTDGTFPLKTMNVGLDPILYSPYMYIPEYFNVFTPAVFSSTKVTGFLEGGNLESIAYSYCFRYKTVDGRTSRLSPLSNPASLPITAANIDGAYVKGGNESDLTGKTMIGEIRNLDSRYSKIQLIYVPYIDGSPSGPGIVFSEYPVPSDVDGESVINWKHTGTEKTIEEVTIAELSNNYVTWDTCQAMETKDNRLFVGNLSNSIETVDTDFRVVSFNSAGQSHDVATGNPNLYNDLLYSTSGLFKSSIGNDNNLWTAQDCYGDGSYMDDYNETDGNDLLYRYIRGPASQGYNPIGYEGEILGETQRRGIFGAESKGFNQPNLDGETEGVRVTFRILSEDSSGGTFPVDLDRDAKLLQQQGFKVNAPYYKLPSGQNGFYNNYANPLYNSNYVGYRRGEIYRFGLLFYDKVGSPMFIKPIGDIRMPEHSAEYIAPVYDSTSEEGDITGFNHDWPYYYQTSRDPKDHGFEKVGSYDNKNESKACVLYPYFEVKLSSKTTSKIGGYAIVRVPRDHVNRTIVTSGIFSRAIKYHEDSSGGETPLEGKFGNGSFPFFTELRQKGVSGNAIARFGGPEDRASRVYTLDSPDAMCDGDFIYNHSSTDRIKLIESGFCQKQNVRLEDSEGVTDGGGIWKFLNIELSDQTYNPLGAPYDEDGYQIRNSSINMFASVIKRDILESVAVNFNGVDYETGTWQYKFSDESQNYAALSGDLSNIVLSPSLFGFGGNDDLVSLEDPKPLGYFTKYYNKRISCYPQYALRNATKGDGGENNNHVGSGQQFNISTSQFNLRTPFSKLNSPEDSNFFMNNPNTAWSQDAADSLNTYFSTEIHFAKVLNPDDEIPASNIPGDSENYKNANIFHELYGQKSNDFDKQQKKDVEDNDVFNRAKYNQNSKTIGIVLNEAGGVPVVRQSLYTNNYYEGVQRKLGLNNDSAPGGDYSPEVTIASIVRKQNKDTMYGGFSEGDFSRNIFQSTGQFKPVFLNILNPGEETVQKDVGENGNAVFGGDTYISYHKYKKTFKESGDKAVCFASMIPLEADFNIDLRHGWNFSNSSDNIPRFIQDEYNYNTTFDSPNNALSFQTKPVDFVDVNHWPCMVAWSEQKTPGEVDDNYSIFPVNQIEDLDYTKGPITQMFLLSNEMFALQYSGTCRLSINPRVLIPSEDGTAIQASTGSGKALERYDYISGKYGSQHFHGLAVSDAGAYYYDDNHCKFLRLGKTGKKGGIGVSSLGDSALMQSYFNKNKNNTINDSPLTIRTITADSLPPSQNYDINKMFKYSGMTEEGLGGLSIGYDPEYKEVLFTLMTKGKRYFAPETIVYNESIESFSSFVSKTAANYFNYDGRLYCIYNTYSSDSNDIGSLNHGLDEIYLSNGWEEISNMELPSSPARYLNFGGIDYYIWEEEVQAEGTPGANVEPIYKEPFEFEFVANDNPVESKIFDRIQLSVNSDTPEGSKYIYFRKFAFKGSANTAPIEQVDTNILGQNYSNIDTLDPGAQRTWYSVKDGLHFIPMRSLLGKETVNQGKTRGTYATAKLTMGWARDDKHPSGYGKIKNEKFNIFSAVPFFRASRI